MTGSETDTGTMQYRGPEDHGRLHLRPESVADHALTPKYLSWMKRDGLGTLITTGGQPAAVLCRRACVREMAPSPDIFTALRKSLSISVTRIRNRPIDAVEEVSRSPFGLLVTHWTDEVGVLMRWGTYLRLADTYREASRPRQLLVTKDTPNCNLILDMIPCGVPLRDEARVLTLLALREPLQKQSLDPQATRAIADAVAAALVPLLHERESQSEAFTRRLCDLLLDDDARRWLHSGTSAPPPTPRSAKA